MNNYDAELDYAELESIIDQLEYAETELKDAIKKILYHKDLEKKINDLREDIAYLRYDLEKEKDELEPILIKEARDEIREREKEYWNTQF